MTLAADTRAAVRDRPFLYEALRAGVVNYTAAARVLDVDGEPEAVAAALRRYASTLPAYEEAPREATVTMRSGLGSPDAVRADDREPLFAVGDARLVPGAGTQTGVLATGAVDATALRVVLGRLATADVEPVAVGVGGDALLVVVERRDGPDAVRAVESALAAVPE